MFILLFYVCKDTDLSLFHQIICKENKEISLYLTFENNIHPYFYSYSQKYMFI